LSPDDESHSCIGGGIFTGQNTGAGFKFSGPKTLPFSLAGCGWCIPPQGGPGGGGGPRGGQTRLKTGGVSGVFANQLGKRGRGALIPVLQGTKTHLGPFLSAFLLGLMFPQPHTPGAGIFPWRHGNSPWALNFFLLGNLFGAYGLRSPRGGGKEKGRRGSGGGLVAAPNSLNSESDSRVTGGTSFVSVGGGLRVSPSRHVTGQIFCGLEFFLIHLGQKNMKKKGGGGALVRCCLPTPDLGRFSFSPVEIGAPGAPRFPGTKPDAFFMAPGGLPPRRIGGAQTVGGPAVFVPRGLFRMVIPDGGILYLALPIHQ